MMCSRYVDDQSNDGNQVDAAVLAASPCFGLCRIALQSAKNELSQLTPRMAYMARLKDCIGATTVRLEPIEAYGQPR